MRPGAKTRWCGYSLGRSPTDSVAEGKGLERIGPVTPTAYLGAEMVQGLPGCPPTRDNGLRDERRLDSRDQGVCVLACEFPRATACRSSASLHLNKASRYQPLPMVAPAI